MDDIPERSDKEAELVAVILAAGMGTRMRSALPKVLHRVAGEPLVSHVLGAASEAGASRLLVVVGHKGEQVISAIGDDVQSVIQEPQLGTGHAVRVAMDALHPIPPQLLVLYGDTPLLRASTVSRLVAGLGGAAVVLLSAEVPDPSGYGRVVRAADGRVTAIVEEAGASPEVRAQREINSGLYCFDGRWLAANLGTLQESPKGEYYLTDLVAMAVEQGREVRALLAEDPDEVLGVNDRMQLAHADALLRARFCEKLMSEGVTILDPSSVYVGREVTVGPDSVVHPGTHLRGRTAIGERCEIGPNSIIVESSIGDNCSVVASMLEQCQVSDRVSIGPFSHLRPGARIASGARIGNYAEVKNSNVGEDVQMHHFGYLGDADVDAGTNVGAGTITCNFTRSGEKHRTRVGKRVFLGSDTLLVAPVTLGDDAATAAGSVVTKDVPEGQLVIGVPAKIRERSDEEPEGGDGPRGKRGESVGS
jgi:bifunctional UDP-N-acetylglucosamine pyrophosphorylase / glucosamine-1-phosphate N-acetyltransferase